MRKLNYNPEITQKAAKYGIYYYEISARLGIADTTFSRMMRRKLDEETMARVLKVIAELAKEGANDTERGAVNA